MACRLVQFGDGHVLIACGRGRASRVVCDYPPHNGPRTEVASYRCTVKSCRMDLCRQHEVIHRTEDGHATRPLCAT